MGKIFCIIGKSSSGKDTVYKGLLQRRELGLRRIVPYTTRPRREGERDGEEYYFVSQDAYQRLEEQGKVIEARHYHTVYGVWTYFTAQDGQITEQEDCLLIGTLEAFCQIRDYFGAGRVVPVYLQVEDGERLKRAIAREQRQEKPGYAEVCRRFLADEQDFSEERLRQAGIRDRFDNSGLEGCLDQVAAYIAGKKSL